MGALLSVFSRLAVWLFTLCFTGGVLAAVAAFLLFQHFSKDLPDHSALANYNPATVTRLYAADGRLLAEYATEKRVFVPLSAVPRRVIQAFLSAEDKNFYQHQGIDFTGLARAVMTNIVHYGRGKSLVGGSTITQQVVKNFLLTDEKSIERKIKEAILATRISAVYSKDKILELYLNEIYLGLRSYGVAAAALNYFNKSLDELTIEEAALLAAMPKAPANYDPRRNYEAAKARRDWVIGRMQEDSAITAEEAAAATQQPITLRARDPQEVANAGFFAEEVRRWLAANYGENALYEGGLVVKTTLDSALQIIADRALRKALTEYDRRRGYRGSLAHLPSMQGWKEQLTALAKKEWHLVEGQRLAVVLETDAKSASIGFVEGGTGTIPFAALKWTRRVVADGVLGPEVKKPADILHVGDVVMVAPLEGKDKNSWDLQQEPKVNGALVALDPHTGKVLAMSGGYAYGGTEFNRATQAMRQPGSAFKPFVYLAALENGFSPNTLILDAPVELSQGAGLPTWKPQNYHDEYYGPTTLRTGLEKSRNTMTVRIAQALGIDTMLEAGKRFGIYENPPRNFSLVLGASETTVLKLASAYASLVNGGLKVAPALVERVDDRHGMPIFRRDTRSCTRCLEDTSNTPPLLDDARERVLDARVAYQMVSLLEGVVQRGTAARARALGRPLAGKTGTTNNSMDTWFVGFSPDLVVGVFVGYDKPQTLGKRETGGSVALPAFISFMQEALKDQPPQPFRIPPGVRLERVVAATGEPSTDEPDGKHVIWEAFAAGEGPLFVPGRDPTAPPPEPIPTGQVVGAAVPAAPAEGMPEGTGPGAVAPPITSPSTPSSTGWGAGGLY